MSGRHDHDHTPLADLGPAFRWAVGLNVSYVIVEATAGFLTGSLALLADAAHNLTDVAGLLIAWGAAVLAKRAGTASYTFGYGRATILAAMFNAIAILIGLTLGSFMAAFSGRLPDRVLSILSLLFYSVPGFWIGLMLIVLFSVIYGLYEVSIFLVRRMEKKRELEEQEADV